MKSLALPLLVVPVFFITACGSSESDSRDPDDPRLDASAETSQTEDTGVEAETGQPDAGPETGEEAATEASTDASEDAANGLLACGTQPSLPACPTTTPPPTQNAAIEEFVTDNAVALRCNEPSGKEGWDFQSLLDASAESNLIMTGEVHGSDQIGPMSAALFKTLARAGRIDVVAIEMPMEWSDDADEWVVSGTGFFGETIVPMMPPAMMWRALPTAAKELHGEGITIPVVGVDFPYDQTKINQRIEAIATSLDPTVAEALLEGLPPPVDYQGLVDQGYVDAAEAYHQHVVGNKAEFCSALDDRTCSRLETYAWALYVGGFTHLPGFFGAYTPALMQWFEDREQLIFMNYQHIFADGTERVYAHMGTNHAGKGDDVVAQWLHEQFEPTTGKLFTLTYGMGPDSVITYRGELEDLDPKPTQMSNALSGAPSDVYFLSSVLPGGDCVGNPFKNMTIPNSGWGSTLKYGTTYDGIVFYRQLSPEGNGAFRSRGLDPRWERVQRWQKMKSMEARWARDRKRS